MGTSGETWDDLEAFLLEKAASGLSAATVADYRMRLSRPLGALGPRPSREEAMKWLVGWKERTSPAPSHYRFILMLLRAYLRFVGIDLGLKLPRLPRRHPKVLSDSQVAGLLAQPVRSTWHGCRDYALMCLLLDTGLRASEAVGARWGDLDEGNLRVRGKGGHERVVGLGRRTLGALEEWAALGGGAKGRIFVRRDGVGFTRTALGQVVRGYARQAGFHAHPHMLRRTFATGWCKAGGNVFALQALLGHNTLEQVGEYVSLAQADLALEGRRGILNGLGKEVGKKRG
jgi:integrase